VVASVPLLLQALAALRTVSLLVDVEPLVMPWRSMGNTVVDLPQAVANFGDLICREARGVRTLTFITNSSRCVSDLPSIPPLTLAFISRAHKPWVIGNLRKLPTPRAVVGDQMLTDGLLAWRLQSTFIEWEQRKLPGTPRWPIVQKNLGRPLQHVIFNAPESM
jgi:predicted HAD superfamily phosphohydrolase YqeG